MTFHFHGKSRGRFEPTFIRALRRVITKIGGYWIRIVEHFLPLVYFDLRAFRLSSIKGFELNSSQSSLTIKSSKHTFLRISFHFEHGKSYLKYSLAFLSSLAKLIKYQPNRTDRAPTAISDPTLSVKGSF